MSPRWERMDARGEDDIDPVEEFNEWSRYAELAGDEGRSYLPIPSIQEYLDRERIARLLKFFSNTGHLDPEPAIVEKIEAQYLRVFCILLRLRRGNLITGFCEVEELQDAYLPFTADLVNEQQQQITDYDPCFGKCFARSSFPSLQFVLGSLKKLTYTSRTNIHFQLPGERGFHFSHYNRDLSYMSQNIFLLKTYPAEDTGAYRLEIENLRRLETHGPSLSAVSIVTRSMTGYIGSFEYRETYNIVLAYADPPAMLKMAAIRGDGILVRLLLTMDSGAPNSKDDAGWIPLAYAAVCRYKEVVDTLLKHGGIPSLRTNDGLTVQELVMQQLVQLSPEVLGAMEQYEEILGLLDSPPEIDDEHKPSEQDEYPREAWLQHSSDEKDVCEYFKANTQFYRKRVPMEVSVWDFIYNESKDANGIEKRKKYLPRRESNWQWLHLPVNNVCRIALCKSIEKRWIKDLILFWHKHQRIDHISSAVSFVDSAFYEERGSTPRTYFQRPGFLKASSLQDAFFLVVSPCLWSNMVDNLFQLYMPYFHVETRDYLEYKKFRLEIIENAPMIKPVELWQRFQKMSTLEDTYQIPRTDEAIDLHLPRTLDESYYKSLNCARDRDSDQVIYRFTKRKSDDAGGQLKVHLLMVNQLWVWKIEEALITAFPEPWHLGSHSLLDEIKVNVPKDAKSLEDMIFQTVSKCVEFLDGPGNGGLIDNWLTIFEESIAEQSQNEAEYYTTFQEHCKSPKEHEDDISNQVREMECLRKTKDIRDELNMIYRVLEDQRNSLSDFLARRTNFPGQVAKTAQQRTSSSENWDRLLSSMTFREERVEKLSKEAERVENWITQLLDLKQKQGNLNEARDTKKLTEGIKKLADDADARARESETQSQLLWLFTIVTVFFTPLSFIAAFFAIPSQSFPHGDSIDWKAWHIGIGMFIAETVTALLLLWSWYYIDRSQKKKKQDRQSPTGAGGSIAPGNDGAVNVAKPSTTNSEPQRSEKRPGSSTSSRRIRGDAGSLA